MPVIEPGQNHTILVSGANGYIAAWLANVLLERGYSVRGTVRTEEKGLYLKELFKEHGDRFEIFVVGDNVKDGAFDEAVKDVDAIAHTASPVPNTVKKASELIDPAVKGTIGILKSAEKLGGSRIKRILILSSISAIIEPGADKAFRENDWNESAVPTIGEKGDEAPNIVMYRASKVLAEKAAWDFYNEHKASISWDLTVINPPLVFGPTIHSVGPSPSSLNTSAHMWYQNVVAGSASTNTSPLLTKGECWVDVRDLVEALAMSLEKEAAGGERIIVSAGSYIWQEWVDVAQRIRENLPKGAEDGAPKHVSVHYPLRLDTAKEKKILGTKFRTMEETTRDTLADYDSRGW